MKRRITLLGVIDAVGILTVIVVTLWSLHPSLLVSGSLLTGGDTGAHVALPAFLRSQGDWWHVTPWYPGWFAGMPAYSYYFVLPDYVALLLSYVVSFAVAFKWATILGSVLMPVGAYVMARLFRAPRPVPLALAMSTLPFLFDTTFTIDGGNLYSTMAGEYAFSLSLALAFIALGYFGRGVRTGRGYWPAAIFLALTLFAHVLPWMFAIVMVVWIVLVETYQRLGHGARDEMPERGDLARPWRFALGAGLLSAGLSAWWLWPFATSQQLTNSMGYTNLDVSSVHAVFSTLGWWTTTGTPGGDRWVIVLAGVGLVVALVTRRRLGLLLAGWSVGSLVGFVVDPQSVIWNERLIPFWFIGIHLLAGWGVATLAAAWSAHLPRRWWRVEAEFEESLEVSDEGWRGELRREERRARLANASAAIVMAGVLSTVPGLVPAFATALNLNTSGNQVTNWASWNYSGYQGKAAWPEYHDLMSTMAAVGRTYGCGRAMWEYSSSENRFGTPMALMLLPYWTNNCIDSMEGLYFESSPTVPYHFLNQAELSATPSEAQVGLPYGPLNVTEGVQHLQMLGVRYFIAFSPSVLAQAERDPALVPLVTTQHWPSPGVTWHVFLVKSSPLVVGLSRNPVVVSSLNTRVSWQNANVAWWLDPSRWSTLLAATGPQSWSHQASVPVINPPATSFTPTTVTNLTVGTQRVAFRVTTLDKPVLVKVSYYPRWHVAGALGPFRVSPNLMVVIPTSHDVSLTYGADTAVRLGSLLSGVLALIGVGTVVVSIRRRGRTRAIMSPHGHSGDL
ncbi:MAG: hypothetical protein HKL87_01375 [Acidimicrobiaceae bacterium]|nr:hypothetical protein [Acidimicrobiaceae bacterium]